MIGDTQDRREAGMSAAICYCWTCFARTPHEERVLLPTRDIVPWWILQGISALLSGGISLVFLPYCWVCQRCGNKGEFHHSRPVRKRDSGLKA